MPQFRDFLARFRPAGSPGAASRVGVAADRARELSAELAPVLALLAPTHRECKRIVAKAERDAGQIMQDARERAAAMAAEAGRRAEAVRAATAEETAAAARGEAGRAVRDAVRRAQQPRRDVEQQINELVSDAVGLVTTLPAEGRLS